MTRFTEKKLGRPFEVLCQEYVDPIGMKDTSYTWRDWFEGRLAFPHGKGVNSPPRKRTEYSAADELCTTARDYARFLISVMRNEKVNSRLAAVASEASP